MITASRFMPSYFYPRSPRGERPVIQFSVFSASHFYPRSPRGERPRGAVYSYSIKAISIHALLAESDERCKCHCRSRGQFLSTLSSRRATWKALVTKPCFVISIHALLAESDRTRTGWSGWPGYFYPRSPRGERPGHQDGHRGHQRISIHALLAESDLANITKTFNEFQFLSTLSSRRATYKQVKIASCI